MSHPMIGMFSRKNRSRPPQTGQRLGGMDRLMPSGSRYITTFMKDPTQAPKQKTKIAQGTCCSRVDVSAVLASI